MVNGIGETFVVPVVIVDDKVRKNNMKKDICINNNLARNSNCELGPKESPGIYSPDGYELCKKVNICLFKFSSYFLDIRTNRNFYPWSQFVFLLMMYLIFPF